MRPILVSVSESLPGCQNIVFCLLFYLTLVTGTFDKSKLQKVTTKVVWAVPGRDVELPCDVTPPVPTDAVSMVFWFKDSNGMPLYSLDARGGPLNESSHLAMSDDLGKRSYFITEQNPARARLKIHQVHTTDEGIFRCRVDFINSPTRNFKVNLTLVVQPSPPKVFDAEGREIIAEAGPFLEGDELFLSCQTNGGVPRPSIIWWNNGTILDNVVDTSREAFTTVNQLLINKVSRTLRGNILECRATSLEMAGDIIREVPIIVYLKPNKVKIVSPNELMSSAKVQTARCETSGSYPPAKISWSLEGKPIRNALLTEEETESFTSSILSLRFEADDDGKDLICRADNPRFPGGYLEDRRQIHVAYPPKVAVRLDSAGTASAVKEGTMVVLRCECVSRPNPHTYSWYHNGHLVPFNETGGIYPTDNTLTIKQIDKSSEGEYSCSATNTEGETYSSPFNLVVQYAPRCKKGYEVQRVGAIAYENMMVQCQVDAIPEVTRFHWTYNTSKGVLPIQGGKMQNKNGVSTLHFSTGTMDVESLSCWATNGVGRQETPCLFYIIPANKPESPRNCIIRNATYGGLEVSCLPGRDGGLQQSFVLEVEDLSLPLDSSGITTLSDQGEQATPLYRVLGEMPIFRLHSLQPGKQYQFLVYAENARGRSSPPVQLSNIRVDVPVDSLQENGLSVGVLETDRDRNRDREATRRESAITEGSLNLTLLLVILAAAAMVLIVGIISVASVLACRRQPTVVLRNRRSSKPPDELELSEAGFNEGFHRRSAQYRASLYVTDADCDRIPPTNRTMNSGPDLILAPVNFPLQSSAY